MKKAIRSGEIKVGDITIKVHVLEDGQRIIEKQGIIDFMNFLENVNLNTEMANKFVKDFKSI